MSDFTYSYPFCSEWLTQTLIDCNRFNKSDINELRIEQSKRRTDIERVRIDHTERDNSINF